MNISLIKEVENIIRNDDDDKTLNISMFYQRLIEELKQFNSDDIQNGIAKVSKWNNLPVKLISQIHYKEFL